MASTQEKIIEIISEELCVAIEEITEEAALIEDYDADSLDHVELAMVLEEAFNISLEDEEMEDVKTVRDVIAAVEKRLT